MAAHIEGTVPPLLSQEDIVCVYEYMILQPETVYLK